MREKRKWPVSIAEALEGARGTAKIRERMKDWRLWERWDELIGPSIAAHARPTRWQGKALILRVDSSAWMQELSYLKVQLLSKLKEQFPASGIDEIRLELGELPPAPKRVQGAQRIEMRPLCGDEREFIERSVERIADPELKEAARRAMSRGFGRKGR